MILFQTYCEACKAKDEIISFLEKQIDHERKEKNNERAEYKRAMDVLLMKEKLPPLGQGVSSEAKQTSPQDILKNVASIFEEEPEHA